MLRLLGRHKWKLLALMHTRSVGIRMGMIAGLSGRIELLLLLLVGVGLCLGRTRAICGSGHVLAGETERILDHVGRRIGCRCSGGNGR